jgi:ornithine cyclodeaminase/alanine dehydrogenase-like protein (mu-crystallin family)
MAEDLLVLTADDVRRALPMQRAIEACEDAYAAYSSGEAVVPLRTQIPVADHDGTSVFMPAHVPGRRATGVKVVSVYPRNAELGFPTIMGMVVLLDAATGAPVALMEGGYLTALRTGAAAGVAARHLACAEARVATLFGAGVQGRTQVLALAAVRPLEEVRVVDPAPGRAEALARDLGPELPAVRWVFPPSPDEAVRGAHVVITATTSERPVFPGEALEPGTHVSAIGSFTPTMQEVDGTTLVRAAKLVVDSREAVLAEAGDIIIPLREGRITADHIWAEIGEIVAGKRAGREDPDEITVYKAVGLAVLDVAAAAAALDGARELGLGTKVRLL